MSACIYVMREAMTWWTSILYERVWRESKRQIERQGHASNARHKFSIIGFSMGGLTCELNLTVRTQSIFAWATRQMRENHLCCKSLRHVEKSKPVCCAPRQRQAECMLQPEGEERSKTRRAARGCLKLTIQAHIHIAETLPDMWTNLISFRTIACAAFCPRLFNC